MSPTVPVYISSFLPTWTQLSGRTSISPNGMAEGKTQQSPPLPALRWDKDRGTRDRLVPCFSPGF